MSKTEFKHFQGFFKHAMNPGAGHTEVPCKNSLTNWDAVWVADSSGPKERCIRWEGVEIPIKYSNCGGCLAL